MRRRIGSLIFGYLCLWAPLTAYAQDNRQSALNLSSWVENAVASKCLTIADIESMAPGEATKILVLGYQFTEVSALPEYNLENQVSAPEDFFRLASAVYTRGSGHAGTLGFIFSADGPIEFVKDIMLLPDANPVYLKALSRPSELSPCVTDGDANFIKWDDLVTLPRVYWNTSGLF